MRRSTAVAAVLASTSLAVGVAAVPGAAARPSGSSPADEHRRVVAFWTPERQARAVPRDASPTARPGGGGSGSGAVTGSTWRGHPNVRRTTGKVFFQLGTSLYTCSGSAVAAAGGVSVVSTAGHCIAAGGGGALATNWIFYPRWNGAADPVLRSWTATALFTTRTWADTASGWDDDAGFARVTDGTTRTLPQAITADGGAVQAIAFSSPPDVRYLSLGYPAAGKYKGSTLTYCEGSVRTDLDANETLALGCDMTGGSSGGPWLRGFDAATGTGTVASVNSYKYASLGNVMFGPIFGPPEQAAYDAAVGGTCSPSPAYACAAG